AGVTIVTQDINKPFYEKSFANARTLNPDRLERSKKKPVIETVGDKKVMSDATRTLELDLIKNNTHNDGILMAFLPKEKILVEVDMYTPPAANAPAPAANAPVNPNALALLDNLEKARLDFDTILPLHGPGKVTRADLYAFVRKPLVPISALPLPGATAAGGRGAGGRGAGGGRGGRGGAAAGLAVPAGPDAAIVTAINAACSSCHTLDRVENKRGDKDDWTSTITRMKGKGAELSEEQVEQAIEYMARTHGPR